MGYGREITDKNVLKLFFSSEISMVDKAVTDAVAFIQSKNAGVDFFGLKLALFEAFTNAVKHGNLEDARKNVKGEVWLDDKFIYIRVEDEGNGFDWKTAMTKKKISFQDTSGRGLILLHSYGYHLEYNEKGNVLLLKKTYVPKQSASQILPQ